MTNFTVNVTVSGGMCTSMKCCARNFRIIISSLLLCKLAVTEALIGFDIIWQDRSHSEVSSHTTAYVPQTLYELHSGHLSSFFWM